jgi:hypothetical protein
VTNSLLRTATLRRLSRRPIWLAATLLVILAMVMPALPARAANCNMTPDGNGYVIIGAADADCTIPAGDYGVSPTIRDFIVHADRTVTVASNTGTGTGVTITVTRDITIDGTLTGVGQGFAADDDGPGAGGDDWGAGGGGAHGGNGGDGNGSGVGGTAYGSVSAPVTLGSEGGDGTDDGGTGGGAIKLAATSGTVTIAGTVSVNGNDGAQYRSGGGAGGSIYIDASTLAGTGTLTANGGNGSGFNDGGAGGAGGRIALYWTTDNSSWSIEAAGGASQNITQDGGAGTIYRKASGATNPDIELSNNNHNNAADTPQAASSLTYDNVTITDGAIYSIPSGGTLTLGSGSLVGGGTQKGTLQVLSGGTYDPDSATVTFQDLDVDNDGTISDVTSLTLNNSEFDHDGALSGTVTSLTFASGTAGSTFYQNGTGLADMTLDIDNDGTFVNESSTYTDFFTLDVRDGATYRQDFVGTTSMTSVTVYSGGTLTHGDNSTTKAYELNLSGTTIDIQSGAAVDADGLGFHYNSGAGKGDEYYNGGGYGGRGGIRYQLNGGPTYGSVTQPTDLGSPSGKSTNCPGGGAVKLVATGTMTVNGDISADGAPIAECGGSGGSIWLDAATLAGAGSVAANGASNTYIYGGGGGGRVAIYYNSDGSSLLSGGKVSAFGGTSNSTETLYTHGGAGTVYVDDKDDANPNGDLIIANNDNSRSNSTDQVTTASQTYDNITIKDGSRYLLPNTFTLALASGGSLSTSYTTTKPDLIVQSGGTFDANASTFTFQDIDVTNAGTITDVANLTLNNCIFDHDGDLSGTVTSLTFASGTAGSAFYQNGIGLADVTLDLDNDSTFVNESATYTGLTSLDVRDGSTYQQNFVGTTNVGALTVYSGGTLTHGDNSTTKAFELNLAGTDIDIQSGAVVDADGLGFDYNNGTGKGDQYYNGGGYGGRGGIRLSDAGGPTYGSIKQPTDLGSPSGYSNNCPGGGAVRLTASGTLTVNGTITVDGSDRLTQCGGSGGSVWLDTDVLSGSGIVAANGAVPNVTFGGGGGGRIAVYYNTDSSTLISGDKINAFGGATNTTDANHRDGGAGTVYLDDKNDTETNGTLVVANNDLPDTNTTDQVTTASQTYDRITIKDGAEYLIPNGFSLTLASGGTLTTSGTVRPGITVDSGGTLDFGQASLSLNGLDIDSSGVISTVTTLTLTDSRLDHNGDFPATVTSVTANSGGTFAPATTTGLSLATVNVNSGGALEQGFATALPITTLTVASGGSVTHTDNSTAESYKVNISATTIDLQAGSSVNVNGLGYDAAQGDGRGDSSGCYGTGGSGGSYGGDGGLNNNGTQPVAGDVYGDFTGPESIGSGGGNQCAAGASGAGAVKLVASTSLAVNGSITANGNTSTSQAGGGSGGSVWLIAPTVTGNGTVQAKGGDADGDGGAGGGGRIAVTGYSSLSNDLVFEAFGGDSNRTTLGDGGAGTVFRKSSSDTNGHLLVSGAELAYANYTSITGTTTVDTLTLVAGSDLRIASGASLTVVPTGTLTGSGTQDPLITVDDGGAFYLPTAGVDGVDITNNGTLGSAATSISNQNATWTNNATVAGVTEFVCSAGTCENNGVFAGGLTTLTIGSGGNYIQTSTDELFSGSDLIIEDGGTFTQNHTETITIGGTLRVETGGTLTHADNSTAKLAEVDFSVGTLVVEAGAFITTDGLGFDQQLGTGTGGSGDAGGGAGHAVAGGTGYWFGGSLDNGGIAYGSATAPTTLGSGGGRDNASIGGGAGGPGGGAIKIIVSGTATINGSVTANGLDAIAYRGGGGAGGSIWLEADTLAGTTGAITADGGVGGGDDTNGGGCGSGGLVRIVYGSKTYTGTLTADNGCTGVRGPAATPTISEEADAPTFSEFSVTPAVPGVTDSVLVETTATFGSGIDRIEIYLDGTDPGDLVHTCDPAGTPDPLSCDYPLGPLSRGSHTVTAKAYGPSAQEGSAADTFTVAAETLSNVISLSSLKAGETLVDFELNFYLDGSSTGTLTVELPSFTVTDDTGTGSSACLSGISAPDNDTITASKVDCSGTVTLTGIQLTNPGSAGSYTITWSNDNGSATVFIVDDDAVSVTGNIDPTLTFDLDVSVIDADSDDPYAVDLGTLSTSGPSGSNGGTIPSIWIDLSTNATGGATVTVSSLYQALRSVSNPSDEISSATATLAGGTEGYGICVASAAGTQAPGDSFTAQGNYAGTCTAGSYDVGALPADSGPLNLLIADGPISGGRSQVRVGASMSTATPAHPDYTDTLTFLATGTF